MEKYKEAGRDARGLGWLRGLPLDLKLGGRMLVRYPGLTIVGGLAMAFAICVGAVVFQMVMLFVSPSLPLPEGDRIVQLRNWDVQASNPEPRGLHDFGDSSAPTPATSPHTPPWPPSPRPRPAPRGR